MNFSNCTIIYYLGDFISFNYANSACQQYVIWINWSVQYEIVVYVNISWDIAWELIFIVASIFFFWLLIESISWHRTFKTIVSSSHFNSFRRRSWTVYRHIKNIFCDHQTNRGLHLTLKIADIWWRNWRPQRADD